MNVCSYVKKTMANSQESIDIDLASVDSFCISSHLFELDELFRIDLRKHKVVAKITRAHPVV